MKMVILRTYKCNSLHCFDSNVCLIYYSRHGAMVKMMILRTYKCNSLHCFDSNMCLIHYSRHGAIMKMMILRTYKCYSLHCFDSNVCLIYYSRHGAMMKMVIFIIIIRQPLCPVVGRRPQHAVSKLPCLVLSSAISCRSSICPGRLSIAWLVSLVVFSCHMVSNW